MTIAGRLRLLRHWWHSAIDGSDAPIDVYLTPEEACITMGVREMACRLNNDAASFKKAAANLLRVGQIRMCGDQLRQLVEAEGTKVVARQQAQTLPPAFTAADCKVPQTSTTRLYLGIDGVMVPTITDAEKKKRREKVVEKRRVRQAAGRVLKPLSPRTTGTDHSYKEFKTITCYDETNEHKQIILSRAGRKRVAPALSRLASDVGWHKADETIVIVDGANWIPTQIQEADLRPDGLGLDFYHLAENVHKARKVVFGSESAEGKVWAEKLLHTFKHEGYEPAREQLLVWHAPLRGKKRAMAMKLLNYVVDRRDMINYPEFRKQDWQIGSGPTEARCRTSTSRLKRSGQRWDMRNAEKVAAVGNLRDSNQWEQYWPNLKFAPSQTQPIR